ncbi:MAG: protein kinase [Proteobacteria bacterium]|nr:protein kinase [Pseudomonadota bacterium]
MEGAIHHGSQGDLKVQTYLAHLAERGIDASTFHLDDRGTLAATLTEVPSLGSGGLVLGSTLGQGGMGIVRAGTQTALDREVAVKTVRPDRDTPGARARVLREAWVTGRLQHPNIVPVYALDRSEDGTPVIVMKRVEGLLWSDLIAQPDLAFPVPSEGDRLLAHLEVLESICLALHYAHAQGILHRDVKPDNVMIGAFGEVTLLDWGLAVGLEAIGPLPAAASIRTVEGTPAYMAPEMAAASGQDVDVQSDVFLLGATLFEVLTGRHRNPGESLEDTLAAAFACEVPVFPASMPQDLQQLVLDSTQRDPASRPQSAEAFRARLAAFRRHQHSAQLVAEAENRVEAMRAANEPALREQLGAEARLTFELALRAWPESPAASAGLTALWSELFEFRLARQDLPAARAALRELAEATPDQERRLEELAVQLRERARQRKDLEELRDDVDKAKGARQKARAAAWLGGVVFAASLGLSAVEYRYGSLGYAGYFMVVLVFVLGAAGDAFRTRRRRHNHASLRQMRIIGLGQAGLIMTGALGWLFGLPVTTTLAFALGVASLMSGVFAQLFFFGMTWASVFYIAAVPLIYIAPDFVWIWVGGASLAGFLALSATWRAEL